MKKILAISTMLLFALTGCTTNSTTVADESGFISLIEDAIFDGYKVDEDMSKAALNLGHKLCESIPALEDGIKLIEKEKGESFELVSLLSGAMGDMSLDEKLVYITGSIHFLCPQYDHYLK